MTRLHWLNVMADKTCKCRSDLILNVYLNFKAQYRGTKTRKKQADEGTNGQMDGLTNPRSSFTSTRLRTGKRTIFSYHASPLSFGVKSVVRFVCLRRLKPWLTRAFYFKRFSGETF